MSNEAITKDTFDAHIQRIDEMYAQLEKRFYDNLTASEKLLSVKLDAVVHDMKSIVESGVSEHQILAAKSDARLGKIEIQIKNIESRWTTYAVIVWLIGVLASVSVGYLAIMFQILKK